MAVNSVPLDSDFTQVGADDFENRTAREIKIERLKILFGLHGFSCSKFCDARSGRRVTGRSVHIVLVMFFFERLAYYSTVGYAFPVSASNTFPLPQNLAFNLIAQLMYPVTGWLADYKVGRHRMMLVGLVLLFVGYSSFCFAVSFYPPASPRPPYGVLYICVVIISIGTAAFQSNAIPFGADQIMFGTSEQLSSYFHWYYWVRNLGVFLGLIPCLLQADEKIVLGISLASVVCVSFALVTDSCCRNKLFIEPARKNPLKSVLKVVWFAITAKRPQRVSAFGYDGRDRPSKIDLAKAKHGGIFSVDEVEDVKTVLQLLPVLLAVGGVYLMYIGCLSVIQFQANVMNGSQTQLKYLCSQWYWFVNGLTIVVFIPAADQLIFPCLRDRVPSMLKRIGLSLMIIFVSICILMVYEVSGGEPGVRNNTSANVCTLAVSSPMPHNSIDYKWVLIPLVLISSAEVLLMVSGLEFFYAQSPHHMRGMAIGFFFFINGLSGTFATVIIKVFQQADHCGRWYYLLELILSIVVFVLFVRTAVWYKYRKRKGLEDSGKFYQF